MRVVHRADESLCANENCEHCEHCIFAAPPPPACAVWCKVEICDHEECAECPKAVCPDPVAATPEGPAEPQVACQPWCSQHPSLCGNDLCVECDYCVNPPAAASTADQTAAPAEPEAACQPWCSQAQSLCENDLCVECEQCVNPPADAEVECAAWCKGASLPATSADRVCIHLLHLSISMMHMLLHSVCCSSYRRLRSRLLTCVADAGVTPVANS